MKLSNFIITGIALLDAASAVAIPETTDLTSFSTQHAQRDNDPASSWSDLFKRKGGGSSGGKGSSSGGSSSSSGMHHPSGSVSFVATERARLTTCKGKTGSSSSSSSSTSSGSRGSTSSSSGGRTTTGSGAPRTYGGGAYYGGGTTVPYRAGGVSTLGLATVGLFGVGALSLAFWPGVWYHPAYLYPYNNPWTYHNATTGNNETKPVTCGCDAYQECGCDDNNSTDYVSNVVGDGSYSNLNRSLVTVANVNGTDTILINGTLPNGTTADGGTESASSAAGMKELIEMAGWWPAALTVVVLAL